MLQREEAPGAPEAGLHLVADEQRARLAAERLRAGQVALRGEVHALALHRLDHERGDVAARELALQRVEVAEGHSLAPGQQRPEALAEVVVAVERERAEREPVEGVLGVEDPRAAGGRARDLDRGLDRLGAAVGGHHRRPRSPARARAAARRARRSAA